MMYKVIAAILLISFLSFCAEEMKPEPNHEEVLSEMFVKNVELSSLENQYSGFNSVNAINEIVKIENEYYKDFGKGESKYCGTVWLENAYLESFNDSLNTVDDYKHRLAQKAKDLDSLHCTIYAMKALKIGLDSNFVRFEKLHKQIYKEHEYAGWSVAYILTKYFDWKAHLIISKHSEEYDACVKNFERNKTYKVWKQPNIPIISIWDFDEQQDSINELLNKNEFGWGFSYQGWHTWVTRFQSLKECNWAGSPSADYSNMPLFIETDLINYYTYNSHIVVFPPKK